MIKTTLKVISLFCLIGILTLSCKKEDDEADKNTINNTANTQTDMSLGGFTCNLDGNTFEMISTQLNDIYGMNGARKEINSSVSPAVTTCIYTSSIYDDITGESAGLSVGKIEYTGYQASDSLFNSLFTVGNKEYSENATNGFMVEMYIDSVKWSTSSGNADQSGSVISITKFSEGELYGQKYVEVEANFSCKLYDGTGNSKTLTDGVYYGTFENM